MCCQQEEALAGWTLKRQVDGQERANITLDRGFAVKAGGKVKVRTPVPSLG